MKCSAKNSTPIRRDVINGRKSIGFIKANTVSNLVKAFSHPSKLSPTPEADSDGSPIVSQISFSNDLSSIYQSPDCGSDSKTNIQDSGYDSTFRKRSKSVGTSLVNKRQSVIESYAQYRNFKWNHLKYFGVDPKEFLASFNIDVDELGGLTAYARTAILDNNNGPEDTNSDTFNNTRKRSQSFSAKAILKPKDKHKTNIKVSNLKYFGIESHRDVVEFKKRGKEIESNHVVSKGQEELNGDPELQMDLESVDPNAGSSKDPKADHLLHCVRIKEVKDLRLRIEKSIKSFESNY